MQTEVRDSSDKREDESCDHCHVLGVLALAFLEDYYEVISEQQEADQVDVVPEALEVLASAVGHLEHLVHKQQPVYRHRSYEHVLGPEAVADRVHAEEHQVSKVKESLDKVNQSHFLPLFLEHQADKP